MNTEIVGKDWTNYIIKSHDIKNEHTIKITGLWNSPKIGKVWKWKCNKCFYGQGVCTPSAIDRLNKHGLIYKPENNKVVAENNVSNKIERIDEFDERCALEWKYRDY
jgi:hypothetical protein